MANEYDFNKLKELVASKDVKAIKQFMEENNLVLSGDIIESKDANYLKERQQFYNLRQYVQKISLNSLYGYLLQPSSIFYDFRLGTSTTMSGRLTWLHLCSAANEAMCNIYTSKGCCLRGGDTDSKIGSTVQKVMRDGKEISETVEDLYNKCSSYYFDERTGKEYGFTNDLVLGYDDITNTPKYYNINYVYRHKTSKPKWEIEDENGNIITVTSDHSCMVERDGKLIEVKPSEIIDTDILITIKEYFDVYTIKHSEEIKEHFSRLVLDNNGNFSTDELTEMKIVRSKIKRCECVGNFEDEYVYDIGIKDDRRQWEFSNNILVHNSCYMSLDCKEFKEAHPDFDYSKDNLVTFSNMVEEHINTTYPDYMAKTFHCENDAKDIMKAGREVVATKGLFCGKKRYALMMVDKDGWRLDTHGKPGKIKIMGIQTQRSDTHKLVKVMLKKMLEKILTDGTKEDLLNIVRDFAINDWNKLPEWKKGKPQACNKLDYYEQIYKESGKCSVSQVLASINWNRMIELNQDNKTPKILDGNKVIVCKLKPNNPFGMTKIAYPVDLTSFPKWFRELPFDVQSMKDSIVDKTIDTIFGVIGWDLSIDKALQANDDMDGFLSFDV
jgi:hypothetical protein